MSCSRAEPGGSRTATRSSTRDPNQGLGANLAGVASLFLLSGLMPILCLQLPDKGRSSAWVLTMALMIWSGIRLAGHIRRGRPELFAFIWWLFVYLFMGVAPTVQIRSWALPTTTPNVEPLLDLPTAIAVVVGVLAFEFGSLLGRGRPDVPTPTEFAPAPIDPRRATAIALVGVGVGLHYINTIGLGLLLSNRTNVAIARQTMWSDTTTGAVVFGVAVYVSLVGVHALARTELGRRTPARTGLIVLACLLVLICANPIGTARYPAGTVLMSLVCLLGAFATVNRARVSMIGIVLGLLFVFPIFDAFRRQRVNFARRGFLGEYAGNGDYDAFAQIANAVRYVDIVGIEWGRQFVGVVLFWVPRTMWPDKPIDTGALLAEYRGYRYTNLSSPLWAESLVNFGWFGLIVVMIGLGLLVRRADRRISQALLASRGIWAVVGGTIPFYELILLRGSLLQAAGGAAVMVLSLLLVTRSPSREPQDPSVTVAR
jgi:hypothetical protein